MDDKDFAMRYRSKTYLKVEESNSLIASIFHGIILKLNARKICSLLVSFRQRTLLFCFCTAYHKFYVFFSKALAIFGNYYTDLNNFSTDD